MKHTKQDIAVYAGNIIDFLNGHGIEYEKDLRKYEFQVLPIPKTSSYLHVLNVSHNGITRSRTLFYFVSGAGIPVEASFGARFSSPYIRVCSVDLFEGYKKEKPDFSGNTRQIKVFSERDFSKIRGELERLAEFGR